MKRRECSTSLKKKNKSKLTLISNEFSFSRNIIDDGTVENVGIAISLAFFLPLARDESFFGLAILSSSSIALSSDADVPSPGMIPSAKRTLRRFFAFCSLQWIRKLIFLDFFLLEFGSEI